MPGVIEATGALRKLQALRDGLSPATEALVDEKVREMQDTAVGLVPRRTGLVADTLASSDAIDKKMVDGKLTWFFGFLTAQAKRDAWYWRFIEFGTRGYEKGERRRAGVDRKGRIRLKRIKRAIPARKAQPFMRPAYILFKQAMARVGSGVLVKSALDKREL